MSDQSSDTPPPVANPYLTRPVYDLEALLELLPWGKTKVYEHIAAGLLRRSHVGTLAVFMAEDVAAYLERLRAGADQTPRPAPKARPAAATLDRGPPDRGAPGAPGAAAGGPTASAHRAA